MTFFSSSCHTALRALGCLLCGLLFCIALRAQTPAVSGRDFIVAVVDALPITNHDVAQRAAQMRQQLQQQGRTVPPADALLSDALEKLINEKALLQHAKDNGIEIDNAAIDQALERLAAQSQLSVEAMLRQRQSEGISAARLRQELRDQLALQRLTERNVPARIKVSDAEIEQVIRERQSVSAAANPEMELAHIFVAVPETASDAQVAALQAKANNALARLQRGETFASVAKDVSDSAEREQGGLMGLRPADRYPTLFVEATQNLGVGGLSPVLRSGAGFHILKLVNKRASNTVTVTETRVRHILLRPGGQLSQVAARAQLAAYRKDIDAGKVDFAKLAQEHSQDASAPGGGDLGWVGPGMFVPEFEEVMNQLAIGQLSDPTLSRFGVHLIQVLARREAALSERDVREMARSRVREKKYDETYQQWVQEVRGRAYVEYRDAPQ